MDKQAYKDMIAEYMKRESELKTKVEELELKLEQQSQDFHFDMRNKQMELVMLQNRLDTLIQGFDDLERENKELRKTIGEVDG
tara:strand:- start:343 stop:591 length:249 start_codon:yes stop_codon:yes gene_type:complete